MKNAKKITSILIIASMSMVMFAGCSATKAATTTNTTTTKTQTSKVNPTAIKTLYTDTLKNLVTAKTITQAQSDKVLAAVIKNVPKGTGSGKTNGTTNKSSGNKKSGTRFKNNQIATLVTSGVITQAQADTINTKISEAMKNKQSK